MVTPHQSITTNQEFSVLIKRQFAALKYGLVFRKPQFLARLALYCLSAIWSRRQRRLRYVDFALAYSCNLKCAHCFAEALVSKRDPLTPSDVSRIARQAIDLGAIHLSLQGGEPTMQPRLREYIEALHPWECLVSLTTNGTLITETLAGDLYRWGVDQLNVSLDSFSAREHDAFRGRHGAWFDARIGIVRALRAGLRVQINTTVSHQNLYSQGFRDLLAWAIQQRLLVNLVLAAPSGNWEGNDKVLLTADDMHEVRRIIRESPWIRHDIDAIALGRGCPAMSEAIYVSAFGDLLACPFMHATFGDLRQTSLADARESALRYGFFGRGRAVCLVAEDRDFIARHMKRIADSPTKPVPANSVFGSPNAPASATPNTEDNHGT